MRIAEGYTIACPRCKDIENIQGHYQEIPELFICNSCNYEFSIEDLDFPVCYKNKEVNQ